MGRGRKSGHDRKEERKEKRAEAKNAKFEKSPRKVTKGSLKKEFKAKQAVTESFKSASSISMDRKEENMLLSLIAMLDNVSIEPVHVHFHGKDKVRTFEVEKDAPLHADDESNIIDLPNSPDKESNEEVDGLEGDSEESDDASSSDSDGSDTSATSSSSSDSDSDSDSESDSNPESSRKPEVAELPVAVNAEGKLVIGRQKYIRQLIRGERRFIREQQKANLIAPSAERVVARLKQSLQPNNTLNTTTSYGHNSTSTATPSPAVSAVHNIGFAYKPSKDRHNILATTSFAANTTSNKVIKPVLTSSVRISAHFDKTGEGTGRPGAAKLFVLQRSLALSDILEMFRVKFKATNVVNSAKHSNNGEKVYKYNAIRIVSSGEILDGFSMLTLPDGEALTLFSSTEVLNNGSDGARSSGGGDEVVTNVVNGPSAPAVGNTTSDADTTDVKSHLNVDVETIRFNEAITTENPTIATPSYWVPPITPAMSTTASATNNTSSVNTAEHNLRIRSTLTSAYQSPDYASIRTGRMALPIYAHKAALLETINSHPVTVVSGETGSGKTTQLPLYLMEQMIKNNQADQCNIVCTQPRRIAAISVAERVNYECAQPGQVGTGLVGYQVRLDSKVCNNTLLTYCTTGVLLGKLQSPGYLSTVSHIILDEVHERGVETDFLMTLLKQQYRQHPNLRVILMSATMQENLFPAYFDQCPIVYVSGRTFPITTHYIEEVHKVVAQGQRLTAIERGKIPATGNNIAVQRDGNSMDRDQLDVKKGYKGKHPRLDKDDPAVLKQRPPKFDAELIAELVIRIITTTNSKRSRSNVASTTISSDSPEPSANNVTVLSNESNGNVPQLSQHNNNNVKSATSTKIGGNNRLANLQRTAAKIRSEATTPTTTTSATATSVTTNTAVSLHTNTDDKANSTSTTSASASTTASEESGDAILVFLSGIQSIEKVSKALRQRGILQSLKAQVHILHGSQPSEVQRKVFKKTLPGEWKIVLATNIAETSITVSDVTHVVDAGYVKELRFDPANGGNSSLQEVFISRAAAQQRAGRAGRVRAGDCWRVYSQEFFESTRVDAFPLPEIQRVPLEEVVLQVLLLNLGTPEAFLSQCLQPPSLEQVRQAIATLLEVRAVLPIPNIPLTALGYHLARMPVDVRIGKMLIYASLLQCLEPVLTIAAALGGKSPFLTPLDSQRVEAQLSHSRYLYTHSVDSYAYSGCKGSTAGDTMTSLSLHKTPLKQPSAASTTQNTAAYYGAPHSGSASNDNVSVTTTTMHTRTNHFSDHIAIVNCYNQFIHIVTTMGSDAAYRYCKERYLNFNVLNEMRALREHFRVYLRQTGFVDNGSRSNKKSGNSINGVDGEDRVFDEMEQMETEMNELNIPAASNSATEEINFALVKCVLCAGLYPNIVRLGRFKETTNNAKTTSNSRHSFAPAKVVQKIVQSDLSEVALHPSSLLQSHTSNILDFMENKNNLNSSTTSTGQDSANTASTESGKSHYELKGDTIGTKDAFLVYYKKMTINKQFLFDATVVPHASVLLFSNSELVFTHKTSRVCVSGWIEMHITELHCILFRRLQREIEDLLRVKVEDPSVGISTRQRNLTYIVSLLVN